MENNINEEIIVEKEEKTPAKKKSRNFTAGNALFLVVLNIILIATIVNLCVKADFWAHYVALGSLTIYFIIFSFLTKSPKNINIRLTFSVLFINFVALFFTILLLTTKLSDYNWIWQYFIPIIIMFNNIITTALLLLNKITFVNALMTFCITLFQSLVQLIFILIFVGIQGSFISVFSIVCFSYSLLGVINAIFIKGFLVTNNIGKNRKI